MSPIGNLYGSLSFGEGRTNPCCGVHDTPMSVAGPAALGLPGTAGEHPVFRALELGNLDCHASPRTLLADKAFAEAALSMSVPGFSYLHKNGLNGVRKWETGAVLGMAAFGKGYCYLRLIRDGLRFRVARVLGPVPRVKDVCSVFRIAGAAKACVALRSVSLGVFHCEESDVVLDGRAIMSELLGIVQLDENARLGAVQKERCGKCGFDVVMEGHESRCRIPPTKLDPGKKLVGDAWHALDVKMALVLAHSGNVQYTVLAQTYVSAPSQKAYMLMVEPNACVAGSSDHSWADAFEVRYFGEFRDNYLMWLSSQLPGQVELAPSKLWSVEWFMRHEQGYRCDEQSYGTFSVEPWVQPEVFHTPLERVEDLECGEVHRTNRGEFHVRCGVVTKMEVLVATLLFANVMLGFAFLGRE